MEAPTCPECGSQMKERMARTGPHAGKEFYGCSRYPKCRAIVNIEEPPLDKPPGKTEVPLSIPRTFNARARFDNYQVQFFQAVGTSFIIHEKLLENESLDECKRAFTQWRLDFPLSTDQQIDIDLHAEKVLSVAEKMLTRGRLTLCSPFIEKCCKQRFLKNLDEEKISIEALLSKIGQVYCRPPHQIRDLGG